MTPSGHKVLLVHNAREVDLLLMHAGRFAAEIAHAVSSRKRIDILARAKVLGVNNVLVRHDLGTRHIKVETYCEHGTLKDLEATGLVKRLDDIRAVVGADALPTWDVLGLQMSKEAHRARLGQLFVSLKTKDARVRALSAARVARYIGPALYRPRCALVLLMAPNALDLVSPSAVLSNAPRSAMAAAIKERREPWSSLVADMPTLIQHTESDLYELRFTWEYDSKLSEQLLQVYEYAFALDAFMHDIDTGRPLLEEEAAAEGNGEHLWFLRPGAPDLRWIGALTL